MAEAIIGGVVQSVADHALSLLTTEIGLALGVKAELRKLGDTVSAIQALVREAEKRQVDNEVVKDWLRKLGDVVYEADDLLDSFSTKLLRHGSMTPRGRRILKEFHIFFSSSNQFAYSLKMAHQVKDLRSRIDAISNDRVQFQLGGNAVSYPESWGLISLGRQTIPCMSEPHVIGRDNDKLVIMNLLSAHDPEGNVTILAIVGIGGLGKTTLARIVFNDKGVKDYFELKLWVCVSTKSINVEDILRKMLKQCGVDKKEIAELDMNELAIELGKLLNGKKYLLVLDDVWDEIPTEWLKLKGYLMEGAKGSKILVTTCSMHVADTMRARPYKLDGLPEDKSLSLLMDMAGKQESERRNGNLENIAKDILKKWAGVPLAIMTVGGLLISRKTEEDWSKFKDNEIARIHQEKGDIMPTLRLSYDLLPLHLKRCFSYCSLFPKDYELDPDELIRLWMAQGFIKPLSNRQAIEDAGHDYFLELLSRSFFQDAEYDEWDNLVRCKMHDLMHDLAQSVSGDDCITMDGFHMNEFHEARHVSVVPSEDFKWSGFERDNGRVKSLLLIATKQTRVGHLNVSCFANLRSLCLPEAGITKISHLLGKMEHLRSLDLSWNDELRSLPNSIKKLSNLETLNLNGCWGLKRLPSGITKLVNLRHLDVRGCASLNYMPRGIGKLTNLHTLTAFVVGSKKNSKAARCKELCKLVKLRKELCITDLDRVGCISSEFGDSSAKIEELALRSLELKWKGGNEMEEEKAREILDGLRPHHGLKRLVIENYPGNWLPSWIRQLDKLVQIEIGGYDGRQLPQLDQLRSLKRISLKECNKLESIELSESRTDQPNLFPSLEEIELEYLHEFRGWERKRGDNGEDDDSSSWMLPRFSDKVKVSIKYCPRFNYLDGQQLLQLCISTERMLEELLRLLPEVESTPIPSSGSLVISECSHLKALPVGAILRCLPNIEVLKIDHCREVDLSVGGEPEKLEGTTKLRSLDLHGILRMETLPWWIQHLTCLDSLQMRSCYNLKAFPEWFPSLTFLRSLCVSRTSEELIKRCQENTGEDWPKMSHIQHVDIW